MPLADVRRDVAGVLQFLRERPLLQRKLHQNVRTLQSVIRVGRLAGQPVGEIQTGRVLAGHQSRPGRRADRTSGVRVRQFHSGFGEGVEMRRPVKGAAVTAEVSLTEIVDHDEDDVRLVRSGGHRRERKQEG